MSTMKNIKLGWTVGRFMKFLNNEKLFSKKLDFLNFFKIDKFKMSKFRFIL